jgi:Ni/Fe-hydrogenase subunit HybB-like protein/nitrate reductase NapAB chaperone NapD
MNEASMNEAADVNSPAPAPSAPPAHATSYPRFLWRAIGVATDGNLAFYAWMTFLTAVALVGANAWAHQVANGMDVTGMTDQVSWGLYIANFTFAVGLAAGGVTMVIPAYLYRDKAMHDVVIVGEILAIAALVTALAFVTVDLGRPDRFWHLIPGIGRFNFPSSMLTWDVIALSGYLLLNLHIAGYMLYVRFRGEAPARRWYVPFVMLSIVWAVSIHTVTAFLYSGLGGRPFWNSALLAPRFIASAFITGPAFVIVSLQLLARFTTFKISGQALKTLLRIMQVTVLLNLFMLVSEVFTEFYTGGAHTDAARYLFFGLHGHTASSRGSGPPSPQRRRRRHPAVRQPAHPRRPHHARLLHDLRRRLDREGHGPHRPRLHPVDAARDRRVLAVAGRVEGHRRHLGAGPHHLHHRPQARGRGVHGGDAPARPARRPPRRALMPILGAVVILSREPAEAQRVVAALSADPRITLGDLFSGTLPVALEVADKQDERELWQWILDTPGVIDLGLVFSDFSDVTERKDEVHP